MNDRNETINFCVKRLINEIQCRPAIWDSRIKEYSDRALKREAWDELCSAFVPHFHGASAAERNGIVALLQKKWKSVRDAFLRELKKNTSKPHNRWAKPYAYFDNLMFLRPVCEVRRKDDEDISYNNEIVTVEYDENDDSDTNDTVSRSTVVINDNKTDSEEPVRKRRRTQDTDESVMNMLAEHIRHKRKRDATEDPDRQFLLSLLPDLKSMDPSVKFDLKFEIMSIIKRYREEHFKFDIEQE